MANLEVSKWGDMCFLATDRNVVTRLEATVWPHLCVSRQLHREGWLLSSTNDPLSHLIHNWTRLIMWDGSISSPWAHHSSPRGGAHPQKAHIMTRSMSPCKLHTLEERRKELNSKLIKAHEGYGPTLYTDPCQLWTNLSFWTDLVQII